MTKTYGFTYKCNDKKIVDETDYQSILATLHKRGHVIDVIYEKDKSGKLHIHGIVEFERRAPLFKTMCPKGFHSKFEELYDIEGWYRYLYKDYFKNNVI